jgi:hypothetical protein
MAHRLTTATIDDEAALRSLLGEPTALVSAKIADRITQAMRPTIAVRVSRDE